MALTALGIVAGLGSAGASAYGASQQGKNDPKVQQIPAPPYAQALQRYMARLLGSNATMQGPSMLEYARSGGTDTYSGRMRNDGMTPGEAQMMGLVGLNGQSTPWFKPGQQELTPEQSMFIGQQRQTRRAAGQLKGPENLQEQLSRLTNETEVLKRRLDGGGLTDKQRKMAQAEYMAKSGMLYRTRGQLFGDEPWLPQAQAARERTDWGQVLYDRLPGQRYSLGMGGGGWGQVK